MKRNTHGNKEGLLDSVEQLLDELRESGPFTFETNPAIDERIRAEARRRFMDATDDIVATDYPGSVEVRVSDDEMSAIMDLFPPGEGGEPIDFTHTSDILEAHGVTHGVDWERVREAIFECNTNRIDVKGVIIARGDNPVNEEPERFVPEEDWIEPPATPVPERERVDHRKFSPFIVVKKGDVLARKRARIEGKEGCTVTGRTLPFETLYIRPLELGKNTLEQDDTVVATCQGRFVLDGGQLYVNEILEVTHDVDYSTGHIDFPGDVIIHGEIKEGFHVIAGGSIRCNKTLDATEVRCGGDLIVNWGIIGKMKGSVKAEGSVKARFIENCYVEAKKTIFVDVGVMNSTVNTLDTVFASKKGAIVGGIIHAQNGVITTQIGSPMGPRTEIYCGIDFTVKQKLEWIRDRNIELATKLRQTQEQLKTGGADGDKLLELEQRLKDALHKMNDAAEVLLFQLDKHEEATVEARGAVYPGVYIEICHVPYVVNRKMNAVIFRLDKAKGKVVAEPTGDSMSIGIGE